MKLGRNFYRRPTLEVARELIGKVLVRRFENGRASGVIVETEAYIGSDDLACHASKGRTPRTQVLFGAPGRTYVYLIYGFHHLLNVVTEDEGFPAAVLIRAIEPLDGVALMRRNRPHVGTVSDIGSGPGKLCQALAVDRGMNNVSVSGSTLWIADRGIDPGPIASSPRIGVDYAGLYRLKPWRFFVEGSPHVSRHRLNIIRTKTSGNLRRKS